MCKQTCTSQVADKNDELGLVGTLMDDKGDPYNTPHRMPSNIDGSNSNPSVL